MAKNVVEVKLDPRQIRDIERRIEAVRRELTEGLVRKVRRQRQHLNALNRILRGDGPRSYSENELIAELQKRVRELQAECARLAEKAYGDERG